MTVLDSLVCKPSSCSNSPRFINTMSIKVVCERANIQDRRRFISRAVKDFLAVLTLSRH